MPNIAESYQKLPEELYKTGAIDAKTKRLIAMTASNGTWLQGLYFVSNRGSITIRCHSRRDTGMYWSSGRVNSLQG